MLKKEDIEHLAALARISISEEEKTALTGQIDAVLEYVSAISGVVTLEESIPVAGELRNVLRDDGSAHPGGEYTDAILANAPHKEDRYVRVEQIM